MIKNYFKLGLRSLAKNRLSSGINILGLALAVGCCLVVFAFLDWSTHFDTFHHKLNNLYVVERVSVKDGNQQYWGNTPAPMGPALKNDFPQVRNFTRVNYIAVVIKQGDNVFRDNLAFVDNAFYQMFDFPVKWGNKASFTDADGIVLGEELSKKLFGKENPVGKTITARLDNNGQQVLLSFTVKGVFAKMPTESSWYFSALVPRGRMISLGLETPGDWTQSADITFVEAGDQASLQPVISQSKKYLPLYNAANQNDRVASFHFQPLRTMCFHADIVNNNHFNSTNFYGYIMLIAIALAILLLVYFNYMNIAIASASARLKEIGVRKVMGSSRKQIVFQFILENLMLCTIAVAIGLMLARYIFVPWFHQIANVELSSTLFGNYRTWVTLFILIVVSAISGAAYPSIYISAFNPVNIMKGNSKMGSKNRFRKSLLGFQFFLTFVAISLSLAFSSETKEIKIRPWGYKPADYVVVSIDKSANYQAFKNELKNTNGVQAVTGSTQGLGYYTKQLVVKSEGKEQTVQSIGALPGFVSQLGISITRGRDLSDQIASDQTDAVLVNQAFVRQMHWAGGIGKNIEFEKHTYKIVGEVNDFHYDDFKTPVAPLVLTGCTPGDINYVYVKMSPGIFSSANVAVEKIWKKVNPNLPFDYHYQDAVFNNYFDGFRQVSQVLGASSMIMIVISISGIFGLALLILGKKMKELSVRKVLGARIGTIIYLINKEFLYAIGIALLFGLPVSWWLNGNTLQLISTEARSTYTPLILSLLSIIGMTVISVSWHIYKAHTSNPTRYLKEE